MQTFLPYPDFRDSARVLDRQRLGKQRVETLQIMMALVNGTGWINHPATRMWRGHEYTLLQYQEAVVNEWVRRGYSDTCWDKTNELFWRGTSVAYDVPPFWLGDEELHLSHQSNLMRKDPEHYGRFFPRMPDDLPYLWPV